MRRITLLAVLVAPLVFETPEFKGTLRNVSLV